MSNFKNRNPNIPKEILDMMPPDDQAPPSHEPVPEAAEYYRGVPVDPATGQALDPFACRDKKNAKRTNPHGGQMARLDDDAPWGC